MCCSRAFRFLAVLTSSAFRAFDHAGHSVRFVASMMLRTVLRTDCSRFRLFLCVCSNAATTIAISMAHAGAHAPASLKLQQKCQVEQGQKNRVRCIYGYFVRFVANMMLPTVLRTDCSSFWLFLCVCVQMQQHLLPFPWLIRCTCTRFIEISEVSSRTGSEEQGQMYIWIFCSVCCKHDATNGASGRLLTFLAVSLCVFKCSNIHCHFHGSSGAHALASLKTQQKCPVEQVRCIYGYDVTVSMVHQVQMQSLH